MLYNPTMLLALITGLESKAARRKLSCDTLPARFGFMVRLTDRNLWERVALFGIASGGFRGRCLRRRSARQLGATLPRVVWHHRTLSSCGLALSARPCAAASLYCMVR